MFRRAMLLRLPMFEVYNVRDDPAVGSLTRVTMNTDRNIVVISRYPQLGPRKEDPSDTTPQFDLSRRVTASFQMHEVAGLIAVMEGKQPQQVIDTRNYSFVGKRSDTGFEIAGTVTTGPDRLESKYDVNFEGPRMTQFYQFLDASLRHSFGFHGTGPKGGNAPNKGGDNKRDNNNSGNRRDSNRRDNNRRR